MSILDASSAKLRTLVPWATLSLVLIVLTWAVVILWWQATQRVVTTLDVMLGLVMLPLAPLASIVIVKWRGIQKKRVSDHISDQAKTTDAPSDAQPSVQALALPILNAWALTSTAWSAGDLAQALAERRMRPQPAPELTDNEGFPILAGRVAALDTSHVEQRLAQALGAAQLAPSVKSDDLRSSFIRSLALLESLAGQIVSDCADLANAIERQHLGQDENIVTLRAAPLQPTGQVPFFQLHVALMVPAGFRPPDRQFALDYLAELLQFPRVPNLHFDLAAASDDGNAIAILNRFALESQSRTEPQALLLIACDSMLCPEVLEKWQAESRLFSARCPNGLMPGEAAFGILCGNDAALDALPAAAICRLSGATFQKREESADTPGKPSHLTLDEAVHSALKISGTASDRIGTVACDTDHRTNRVLECIGTMMTHTPHLDAIQNRLAVNEACGHLGAASSLGVVTAGALHVAHAEHPVLLLNISHATDRAAAILLPPNAA